MRPAPMLWSLLALLSVARAEPNKRCSRRLLLPKPSFATQHQTTTAATTVRGGGIKIGPGSVVEEANKAKTPFFLSPTFFLRFLGLGAVSFGVPGYFFPEFIHDIIGRGVINDYLQLYQTGWAWRESMMGILSILAANSGNADTISGATMAMTAAAFFGFMQDLFGNGWNPDLGYWLAGFHGSALLWGLVLIFRDKRSRREKD